MTAPHSPITHPEADARPVTVFGPDFPFAYDNWLKNTRGLGSLPARRHGTRVAIVGAGIAGMIAAYELMKMGVRPVLYEASRIGGRLRSEAFQGAEGIIAELGGMRFPRSGTGFFHYVDLVGLDSRPFPNPLAPATPSTVIDLEGKTIYVERPSELPPMFQEIAGDWQKALEEGAGFSAPAGGDPGARRRRTQGTLEPAHPDLGRPLVLRFRRHLVCLPGPLVPASRGLRPGRLRHRRLGFGLSQFHARNSAGRGDQL